jgi:hypothetical protein
MAFQLAAALTGLGATASAIGHFTQNRDLLKIGQAGQLLGSGLGQINKMTAGAAASGAKEATTAENFSLGKGSALDSVLEGLDADPKSWGDFGSLLKKGTSTKSLIPDLASGGLLSGGQFLTG